MAAAMLLCLLAAPSIATAGSAREAPAAIGQAPARSSAPLASTSITSVDARDYAAREAAAPALAQFAGGDGAGIYIGGSALTVVLLVLLIVIIL